MPANKISKTSERKLENYIYFRNEHEAMPDSEDHLRDFICFKEDLFACIARLERAERELRQLKKGRK